MAEMGLAARPKRRRTGTTRTGKGRWRASDLVKRDFPMAGINQKWYGDGTDIDTDEGKLYLIGAGRGITPGAGVRLGDHHDADLAYGAPVIAVAVRGGHMPGVIFHTDQGRSTPRPPFGPPAPGCRCPSQWAGSGRLRITRSSNRGTRP